MDEEEFEFILTAIEFVSIYGQRFLPLYNFNLKNGNWRIKKQKLETLMKENKCYFKETKEKTNNDFFKADGEYNVSIKSVGKLRRKSFLAAKCIASRLPKFPSQSIVYPEVDPSVLHFIV